MDGCQSLGTVDLQYDSIGVGAGVKSETNRLASEKLLPPGLVLVPWNAGAPALMPDEPIEPTTPGQPKAPLNKDFYGNLKAQAWWQLRRRFEKTFRALTEPGFTWKAEELISLPSTLPMLRQIQKELSQPTSRKDGRMRLIVDKTPEGTRSPNVGDVIVMAYWPIQRKLSTMHFLRWPAPPASAPVTPLALPWAPSPAEISERPPPRQPRRSTPYPRRPKRSGCAC